MEDELQPLMQGDEVIEEERITYWSTNCCTCLGTKFDLKTSLKYLIPLTVLLILGSGYVLVYIILLPPVIKDALNGPDGSQIESIFVKNFNPVEVDVSLLINIDEPPPVKVDVNIGEMSIFSKEHDSKQRLARFTMPQFKVFPKVKTITQNVSIEIRDVNYQWIHWFVKQSSKHEFKNQTFVMSSKPKVQIPSLLATFVTKMKKIYKFEPSSTPIDLDQLDFKASDVSVDARNTSKGTFYKVAFTAKFSNPFPVTIQKSFVKTSCWIYYQNVPIIHVWVDEISLESGENIKYVKAETLPEYGEELMNFVGEVSEGQPTPISIRDINFVDMNAKWDKIQDMVDGWTFEVLLPPIEDPDLWKINFV